MPSDDEMVQIQLRLKDARKFIGDAKLSAKAVDGIGNSAARSDKRARAGAVGFNLMRGSVSRMTTAVKFGSIALVSFATLGLGAAVRAFAEAEVVGAKVNAVIKATGGVAGVSAEHVGKLADSLSLKTGVDDEAIASAEALLLTFKAVRNDANGAMFDRATKAALDLSTVTGKPLETSITAIGKALQDPAKGAAALSKQGSLAKTELKQLQDMADAGVPVWKQQDFILKALEGQYGGVAEAAGNTFTGALNRAKVMVGNLGEGIGGILAPSLHRLIDLVTTGAGSFMRARDAGARMGFAIATAFDAAAGGGTRFRDGYVKVEEIAGRVWQGIKNLAAGARDLVAAFLPTKGSVDGAGGALERIATTTETVTVKFREFGAWMRKGGDNADALRVAVLSVVGAFAAYRIALVLIAGYHAVVSASLTVAIAALYAWGFATKVVAAANRAFTIGMLALNLAIMANPFVAIGVAIVVVIALLVLAYKKVDWFRNAVNAAISFVVGFVRDHWKLMLAILTGPLGLAVLAIIKYRDQIVGAFRAAVGFVRNHWRLILSILTGPIGAWVIFLLGKRDQIIGIFKAIIGFVRSMPGMLAAAGKGMWSWVADGLAGAFKGATSFAADIGKRIANALIGGLNDMLPDKISIPGSPDINLPNNPIPMLARGGNITHGGLAIVGDGGNGSGTEVVDLPRGARVRPLSADERSVHRVAGGAVAGGRREGRASFAGDVYLDGRKVGTVLATDTEDDLARR